MRALASSVRWRLVCSGNEAPVYGRCGLFARNDSVSAMPRAPSRERQLLNAGALININHMGLSCCSSMLRPAAGPYNAAKFGLAYVARGLQIAYSSLRRVLRAWKGLFSSSSSSLVRGSRDMLVRDISCRGFQRSSLEKIQIPWKRGWYLGLMHVTTRSSDSNKNLMFREFNSWSIHILETPEFSMEFSRVFELSTGYRKFKVIIHVYIWNVIKIFRKNTNSR